MQYSVRNSTEAHLQLFSWNIRITDGFGKSFLIPCQYAGKEIAVSTFQSRECQFVGSVVIVYSIGLWFCQFECKVVRTKRQRMRFQNLLSNQYRNSCLGIQQTS